MGIIIDEMADTCGTLAKATETLGVQSEFVNAAESREPESSLELRVGFVSFAFGGSWTEICDYDSGTLAMQAIVVDEGWAGVGRGWRRHSVVLYPDIGTNCRLLFRAIRYFRV